MKKMFVLLTLMVIALAMPLNCLADYAIYTWWDLQNMQSHRSDNCILMNDLDENSPGYADYQSGTGFDPIGHDSTTAFTGNFDGQYHVIKNLYINLSGYAQAALFGDVRSSTTVIKNVGLENVNISGGFFVAGLVGYQSMCTVRECYVTGTAYGTGEYIGGVAGATVNGAKLINCYSHVTVTSPSSWTPSIGSLTGRTGGGAEVWNCYSTGTVTVSPTVNACYWGALIGFEESLVVSSYWDIDSSGVVLSGCGDAGVGKTTDEMLQQATFVGWDFTTTWDICECSSYPTLKWQMKSCPPSPDNDGDTLLDCKDNCPSVANIGQEDTDGSGIGDACNDAVDPDGDDFENSWTEPCTGGENHECADNCPNAYNPDQTDSNGDGYGDACQPTVVINSITHSTSNLIADATIQDPNADPLHGAISIYAGTMTELEMTYGMTYWFEGVEYQGLFSFGYGICDYGAYQDSTHYYEIAEAYMGQYNMECSEVVYWSASLYYWYLPGFPCTFCVRKIADPSLMWQITVLSFNGDSAVLQIGSKEDKLVLPYTEALPASIDISGAGLIPGETYTLKITTTDDNTQEVFTLQSFVYQAETTLLFGAPVLDTDGDGVNDDVDNCISVPNPNQADQDGDGIGDLCDTDRDDDGILNTEDNCPKDSNFDQTDTDSDGIGDACDLDIDGDGVENTIDNCSIKFNPDQADFDADGLGDICDPAPANANTNAPPSTTDAAIIVDPEAPITLVTPDSNASVTLPAGSTDGPDTLTVIKGTNFDFHVVGQTTSGTGKLLVFAEYSLSISGSDTYWFPGGIMATISFLVPRNASTNKAYNNRTLAIAGFEDTNGDGIEDTYVTIPNCASGSKTPDGRCTTTVIEGTNYRLTAQVPHFSIYAPVCLADAQRIFSENE